ncbi:hypothetical protein BKH43_07320 [Helicobacter sp. 13S00401-1]|uniref:YceI family protein n=1 Tax=Helicobacter sp. 13S00401-1 TaxID=1905758 RepID=UPI000BA579EE|nr:YceI family protein [Helicobacter sp. 13S00401-1]PAF49047.1 hypothetical protein BKH43_07320 [Helicobacter sp. 13S00401-1]
MSGIFKKVVLASVLVGSFAFAGGHVEVLGTSTLHDWKMQSSDLKVDMLSQDNKPTKIEVSMVAQSLKSTEGKSMDKNAYKAMKVTPIDVITYVMKSYDPATNTLVGIININGKDVDVSTKPKIVNDKEIEGSFKTKITDFGMVPPKFMLGAMKVGDEITINYKVTPDN